MWPLRKQTNQMFVWIEIKLMYKQTRARLSTQRKKITKYFFIWKKKRNSSILGKCWNECRIWAKNITKNHFARFSSDHMHFKIILIFNFFSYFWQSIIHFDEIFFLGVNSSLWNILFLIVDFSLWGNLFLTVNFSLWGNLFLTVNLSLWRIYFR